TTNEIYYDSLPSIKPKSQQPSSAIFDIYLNEDPFVERNQEIHQKCEHNPGQTCVNCLKKYVWETEQTCNGSRANYFPLAVYLMKLRNEAKIKSSSTVLQNLQQP
ncbi:MAG: hypothetical protein MHPSP_002999, partial [Paramarteilia canceri]